MLKDGYAHMKTFPFKNLTYKILKNFHGHLQEATECLMCVQHHLDTHER